MPWIPCAPGDWPGKENQAEGHTVLPADAPATPAQQPASEHPEAPTGAAPVAVEEPAHAEEPAAPVVAPEEISHAG